MISLKGHNHILQSHFLQVITQALVYIYDISVMMLEDDVANVHGGTMQEPLVGKAVWNVAEVSALINYLHTNCVLQTEAGSFKMPAFNSAAHAIASHHTAGPMKTGAMCKIKWSSVCDQFVNHVY
ncbi:hypothetical protein J3R83DRAFT_9840 [Lanmaoa asiatica]|nr:hypothetical protein J3R83DRAFT_9840 [Lanmaoa asiatica]